MTTNEQDELDRIFNDLEHGMPYSISGWDDAWPQAKAALQAYIAQHTKEAVRSARIDELKALLNAEVIKPQYHNVYVQHIKEMEK